MKNINKVLICFLLTVLASAVKTQAQNNAYGIDDECYVLFQRVESLAGGAYLTRSSTL